MNFTGKKLCKPAALAALLLALTLATPAWLSAATYSVGEGGDYASLKEIVDSGVLASGDEINILGNDGSLNGGDYSDGWKGINLPKGVTFNGKADGSTIITQGAREPGSSGGFFLFASDTGSQGELVFNNLTFQGDTGDSAWLFYADNSLDLSGSNVTIRDFNAPIMAANKSLWLHNIHN